VPRPVLSEGDALVRVHACGVSPDELSWNPHEDIPKQVLSEGDGVSPDEPSRSSAEWLPVVLGYEISGIVEALAPDVREVKAGNAIYALTDFLRNGGAAEYIAVRAADLAPKPNSLDFVQAASVPLSALTAWQALFDHGRLTGGQTVLIHGAAGGVGSFAVQLVRWRKARVIASDAARNADFLRRLGAEEVIDYASERFENRVSDADMVLDLVGGETLERSWGVLRREGVLVTTVAPIPKEKGAAHGVKGVFFIVKPSRQELTEIARLIDEGHVRPMVDAVFPLERAREAFEKGLSRRVRGKLVLEVVGD
jgi:NADPH:quinone reductase-like Zn-dependent oxidoreductase